MSFRGRYPTRFRRSGGFPRSKRPFHSDRGRPFKRHFSELTDIELEEEDAISIKMAEEEIEADFEFVERGRGRGRRFSKHLSGRNFRAPRSRFFRGRIGNYEKRGKRIHSPGVFKKNPERDLIGGNQSPNNWVEEEVWEEKTFDEDEVEERPLSRISGSPIEKIKSLDKDEFIEHYEEPHDRSRSPYIPRKTIDLHRSPERRSRLRLSPNRHFVRHDLREKITRGNQSRSYGRRSRSPIRRPRSIERPSQERHRHVNRRENQPFQHERPSRRSSSPSIRWKRYRERHPPRTRSRSRSHERINVIHEKLSSRSRSRSHERINVIRKRYLSRSRSRSHERDAILKKRSESPGNCSISSIERQIRYERKRQQILLHQKRCHEKRSESSIERFLDDCKKSFENNPKASPRGGSPNVISRYKRLPYERSDSPIENHRKFKGLDRITIERGHSFERDLVPPGSRNRSMSPFHRKRNRSEESYRKVKRSSEERLHLSPVSKSGSIESRRAREKSFERLNLSPVSQAGSFERREFSRGNRGFKENENLSPISQTSFEGRELPRNRNMMDTMDLSPISQAGSPERYHKPFDDLKGLSPISQTGSFCNYKKKHDFSRPGSTDSMQRFLEELERDECDESVSPERADTVQNYDKPHNSNVYVEKKHNKYDNHQPDQIAQSQQLFNAYETTPGLTTRPVTDEKYKFSEMPSHPGFDQPFSVGPMPPIRAMPSIGTMPIEPTKWTSYRPTLSQIVDRSNLKLIVNNPDEGNKKFPNQNFLSTPNFNEPLQQPPLQNPNLSFHQNFNVTNVNVPLNLMNLLQPQAPFPKLPPWKRASVTQFPVGPAIGPIQPIRPGPLPMGTFHELNVLPVPNNMIAFQPVPATQNTSIPSGPIVPNLNVQYPHRSSVPVRPSFDHPNQNKPFANVRSNIVNIPTQIDQSKNEQGLQMSKQQLPEKSGPPQSSQMQLNRFDNNQGNVQTQNNQPGVNDKPIDLKKYLTGVFGRDYKSHLNLDHDVITISDDENDEPITSLVQPDPILVQRFEDAPLPPEEVGKMLEGFVIFFDAREDSRIETDPFLVVLDSFSKSDRFENLDVYDVADSPICQTKACCLRYQGVLLVRGLGSSVKEARHRAAVALINTLAASCYTIQGKFSYYCAGALPPFMLKVPESPGVYKLVDRNELIRAVTDTLHMLKAKGVYQGRGVDATNIKIVNNFIDDYFFCNPKSHTELIFGARGHLDYTVNELKSIYNHAQERPDLQCRRIAGFGRGTYSAVSRKFSPQQLLRYLLARNGLSIRYNLLPPQPGMDLMLANGKISPFIQKSIRLYLEKTKRQS